LKRKKSFRFENYVCGRILANTSSDADEPVAVEPLSSTPVGSPIRMQNQQSQSQLVHEEPVALQANFVNDENQPGVVIIGSDPNFKVGVLDYGRMVAKSSTGSALALKLLRKFMTPEELKLYSYRGTKSTVTGEYVKLCLADHPLTKAIIKQAQLQYPDFKVNASFKKSVSTLCSGNH